MMKGNIKQNINFVMGNHLTILRIYFRLDMIIRATLDVERSFCLSTFRIISKLEWKNQSR